MFVPEEWNLVKYINFSNANKLIHLNQTSLARNNKKDQNGEFIQMSRRQIPIAKNKVRNWYESQTT